MYELKTISTLVFTWIFAYLGLSKEMFIALCFLLVIDSILGYINAVLKREFQSVKAISGLAKKIVVLFIPISISIYWIIVWTDVSSITAWIFALLWIAEVYSIVWKIYEIKTGKKISEFDAMTAVIWFIGWKINSEIERMLTINNKK